MRTAKELMTHNPTTVFADTTIRDAAVTLQRLDVRHLPVLDRRGSLVGMVSDRDLHNVTIPRLLEPEQARELRTALEASVATIMSPNVVSIGEDATIADVVGLILEKKIGALPVVNGSGRLVGIVGYMDVLRQLPLYSA
jgi:acetoin utilization protein AcuB